MRRVNPNLHKNNPNINNPKSKVCYGCQKKKNISEFNKCKTGVYGLHNHCRSCQKENKRKNYLKNRDKELLRASEYSKTEKAKQYRKKRYEENKEELKLKNNIRRRNNEAKEKAREQRQKWMQKPHNRIACNLRSRIRSALSGATKGGSTEALTGIPFNELKSYLESKFLPGMSWDNYGEWHIDHIKPCASFDLTNEEEQRQCFHYTNLQPLWAKDNISKGDK